MPGFHCHYSITLVLSCHYSITLITLNDCNIYTSTCIHVGTLPIFANSEYFIILMVILSNYMYSLFRNMTVDRFTAVAFSLGAVLLLKFIYGYREVRVKEETENLNNFCEPRRFCDESLSSFLLSTGIFPPKNYVRRNVDAPDGVVPMNFRLIRIKQKAAYMSNR